jgi:hypothetical protein
MVCKSIAEHLVEFHRQVPVNGPCHGLSIRTNKSRGEFRHGRRWIKVHALSWLNK